MYVTYDAGSMQLYEANETGLHNATLRVIDSSFSGRVSVYQGSAIHRFTYIARLERNLH